MKKTLLIISIFLSTCMGYCGEIGDGNGASYPVSYDTTANRESSASYWSYLKAQDIKDILIAHETTLGLNPQGGYSTVTARLNAIAVSTTSAIVYYDTVITTQSYTIHVVSGVVTAVKR